MDQLRNWEMSASVDQDLPIILGDYQVNSFKTKCKKCGQAIKNGLLRGELTKSEHEIHVEGYGACFSCKVLTHYDLTLTYESESGRLFKKYLIDGHVHESEV